METNGKINESNKKDIKKRKRKFIIKFDEKNQQKHINLIFHKYKNI